jgi:hypothetical protein
LLCSYRKCIVLYLYSAMKLTTKLVRSFECNSTIFLQILSV